jgi:peptidoglycan/xylan/chitin deacetylase (PgdA/CDA1 family)
MLPTQPSPPGRRPEADNGFPWPVIVAYHAVSSTWRSPLAVSEETLWHQLDLFRRRGYIGLTLADSERRRLEGQLPPRSLVVTFDDGFHSVLRAKPILEELGFPATVFVVTSLVDSGLPLEWPGLEEVGIDDADDRTSLSWEELGELREEGWEVGSHTVTHAHLPDLDDARLEEELTLSRDAVAARFGSCDTISYPYGLADRRVAAAAERAGYVGAVTLTRAHAADERFLRPRVNHDSKDHGLRLHLTLSMPGLKLRRSKLLAELEARAGRPPWVPSAPVEPRGDPEGSARA